MKKTLHSYGYLALVAGTIIAADQITKAVVRANLNFQEVWAPWDWMLPYARIVHWYNTGAAFGIFQGGSDVFKYMAVLVALAIIYYFPRVPHEERILRLALAMQLGGAVGNLIDRIALGHVTDFISVGRFPVFNVADASITIGVGVLVLAVVLQDYRERKAQTAAETRPEAAEPEKPVEDENHP